MANTPQLRTGRMTTFLASLFTVLVTSIIGIGQFVGLSAGFAFTLVEAIALLGGSLALLTEIFLEGARTGIRNRDYDLLDILGASTAVATLFTGLIALMSALAGTPSVGLPPSIKGIVIMVLPVLLASELFRE